MRTLAALAVALALPGAARAETGSVDWQRRVVRCTGTGAPNLQASGGNVASARIGAERAAKLDALRNCMEAVKGVRVSAGQTAGAAMAGDPRIESELQAVVKGFRVVGAPRYFSDGGVEMDVEVPLDGKLSDALLPKGDAKGGPGSEASGGAPASAAVTGLIVDARGRNVAPALAPRILDEGGRELYGPASLAAGARERGGAAYARDVETAKRDLRARVGERPLVVKAVGVRGADVLVAEADAKVLSGGRFLAEGRVVIVTD